MEKQTILDRVKRKEKRRRKRERRVILLLGLLFSLSLYLEINFLGLSQKLPFVNSILFFALMNVNIILIGLLVFLVFRNVIKLIWERYHKILGAKLKTKLVVVFVSFTIIPTILLFTVSLFYINNSFGRWFNFKIADSLQNAVDVHADYTQGVREKSFHFGKKISNVISSRRLVGRKDNRPLKRTIQQLQKEYDLDSIEIFSNLQGMGISTVSVDFKKRLFPPLEQQFLKEGFSGRQASITQNLKEGSLVRSVLPVYEGNSENIISALVISSYIPPMISKKISKINSTFQEYRGAKTIKKSLKTIYITILVLISILIIFAAIWLGFHIAREITTPIRSLIEGTQAVALGNLDVKIDYHTKDDLSSLVKSFNKMTSDLRESNVRLAKAQRIAAWREVARRIAHEIKNPLTPIKLSAQRLRRKYLSHKDFAKNSTFDDCTKMIITQVDELKDLVNEFSSFAKLPEAAPRPCHLDQIIKEVISIYQQAHKTIRFDFNMKQALPQMDLDRDQIKRVLINLVDNAIAAMLGSGKISIRTRLNATLQFVVIEISDTGSGLPDEVKPRLFEPYFSTKKGGTGLGLAIARKIITDHQGYIRVMKNHPKGTTFIIELPMPPHKLAMLNMRDHHDRPHLSR